MLYISISVIAGISIVLTRILNANLAKTIGIFQGTFFNYIIGLIFSFFFMVLNKESLLISGIGLEALPIWAFFGGAVGVAVIVLSNYTTPKISSLYLTLFIFVGQLSVGIIIDYFTINELSLGKILGGLFVFAGLYYNLVLDQKKEVPATSL